MIKAEKNDSHNEDGGGDERGGEETSLAVDVLSLSLVHLPSAVVTAPAQTETQADDGGEDQEDDADGRTYEESGLVVDPLQEEEIFIRSQIASLHHLHAIVFWENKVTRSLPGGTAPHFLAVTPEHMHTHKAVARGKERRQQKSQSRD